MDEAQVKRVITKKVWEIADHIDWRHLTITQKKQYYEKWTNDPEIGGILVTVMESERVRVYLKDTVMKQYARDQLPELDAILEGLGIKYVEITKEYIKPTGMLCDRQDIFSLAPARIWKIAIMNAYERGCEVTHLKRNIVFITDHTAHRFIDRAYQELIESAATRLGVEVRWVV